MATSRQAKVARDLVENGGSIGKVMLKAGYSKAMAKNPKKLTQSKGFKEVSEPIVAEMVKERNRAIKRLAKTIGKAKYRDLVDGVDKLTKNIELLSGRETERITVIDEIYKKL